MIEEIRIADLGVIGAADVTLGPGLTVLTGETGAGKTMVLTALSLLLGSKADPATVRTGAAAASVEGRVVLTPGHPVLERAAEAGGDVDDDGSLLLVRTVSAAVDGGSGRSRAIVGGRSVPQAVLGELAQALVTVHGQADQARLRSSAHQRAALDAFAGPEHAAVLAAYREAWTERTGVRAELDELVARAQDRTREAELLRLGLAELERVDPQPGEDLDLATEEERLAHAEELRVAAAGAHAAIAGDTDGGAELASAAALVEQARRALDHVAAHDRTLAELSARVADVGFALADVAAELSSYAEDLQADPRRLEVVNQRRAELATLTRAYGSDVAEVLEWARTAGLRLLELDGGDQRIDELRAHMAELDTRLVDLAAVVTAARRRAALRLADAVTAELAGLAMAGARLEVEVRAAAPGPSGADDVEMLLVAHAGAPARPLGKGASGGELSRIMLALEVALAQDAGDDRPGTFVFDEIDAGVGGKAAVEIGRRLARLARDSQVLVVTHLAQVAAFADRHLVVTKSSRAGVDVVTASDVTSVTGEARVRELARMLSGQEESDAARAHAAELLELSGMGR